jgi:hypothetical protein
MAYELIKHTVMPAGVFYVGQVEQATFDVTLPPEQLPGMSWFADRITNALIQGALGQGTILETKVYFDSASWYDCRYRIVALGHGSPIAWPTVIAIALVVIGLAIVAWILREVVDKPYLGIGLVGLGIGVGAIGVTYLVKSIRSEPERR